MAYDDHMTQPPYGQNTYSSPGSDSYPGTPAVTPGTPGSGANTPQYGAPAQYPSAPPPVPQYPTAPAYSPQPVYQAPSGYSAMPVYSTPTAPQKKPAILGIVGAGVVLICGIIFFICALAFYRGIFNALGPDWVNTGVVPDTSTLTQDQLSGLMGPMAGLGISSLFGIAGFIISIVATAQNKGRVFGIVGIILGVLAPLTFFMAAGISIPS